MARKKLYYVIAPSGLRYTIEASTKRGAILKARNLKIIGVEEFKTTPIKKIKVKLANLK